MSSYQDSLVGFYDILGFSEYVRGHTTPEDVRRIFRRVRDASSIDPDLAEMIGSRSVHFSDTIIRTTPFLSPSGEPNRHGILIHEILDALHFQIDMISQGLVFVRGAITCGQAIHTDTEVFGPAVIRAYELERDVVIFPRIIVDPVVVAELVSSPNLRGFQHTVNQERYHFTRLMRLSEDGVWFIDYLRAVENELDDPTLEYVPFLRHHRDMILRGLAGSSSLTRVTHKYLWLAHYHNGVVSELRDDDSEDAVLEKPALFITSDNAPLYQPLPNKA